jgi:hypothetical protein
MSNHGPGSRLQWERPDAVSLRERMGILFAARVVNGDPLALGIGVTPVNAFRLLLHRATGARLPLLDDRSYFSTWARLTEYADVTEQVR